MDAANDKEKWLPKQEYYDAAEADDGLVWKICVYNHSGTRQCKLCPAWEDFGHGYGPSKRGCRMLAEETIAMVLAWQERGAQVVG